MNPSTPDVRNLTQKELSASVKAHENADGTASQFTLPGSDIHVTINACYVGGSGQHRAWKYLYYLTVNGRKFGGYDRRDSFVAWAIGKIKEVAPQQGVAGVSDGCGQMRALQIEQGQDLTANGGRNQSARSCENTADSQISSEVASPESSTAQTDTTGMAAKASVDVPEEIEVYPQDATEKGFPESFEAQVVTLQSRGSLISGVVTGAENETKAKLSTGGEPHTHVLIPEIEELSDFNDEGETAWNAIRRAEVARKMQRIAAGGYNSVDQLISTVEELAEVGQ